MQELHANKHAFLPEAYEANCVNISDLRCGRIAQTPTLPLYTMKNSMARDENYEQNSFPGLVVDPMPAVDCATTTGYGGCFQQVVPSTRGMNPDGYLNSTKENVYHQFGKDIWHQTNGSNCWKPLEKPVSNDTKTPETPPEWANPSGPRKSGEGVEDEIQGVYGSEFLPCGGIELSVTLLVAGFIIGPSGVCIRDIINMTGADITSSTRCINGKKLRVFRIKGSPTSISNALRTVLEAVWRYKYLAEGPCAGQHVDWCQVIRGVEFFYQPPPKGVVPHAAAIKVPRTSYALSPSGYLVPTAQAAACMI